jgi:hypothetical protein
MSIKWKTYKYGRKTESQNYEPSLIVCIYMYCIYDELIDKPRHHDDEYGIHMERDKRKGRYIEPKEWVSANGKKQECIIECNNKRERSLGDEKSNLSILVWVFEETVTNVLDFSHFFL